MRHARLLAITLLLLALSATLVSANTPIQENHHALVRITLNSDSDTQFIKNNIDRLDVVYHKPGSHADIAAQPAELKLLEESGLQMEIVTADMENEYASRSKGAGFGIFHTYSENTAFVDSLRQRFPEVISEKWSIGQSHGGRDIWCFRVSANPDIDEDEPEILIDGMHHAREIMAGEFTIMFAEYLGNNYGVDPEITWLLNNRELYIVPIVNPDGVVYNEQTDPNGGGMWRKNRRNNGNTTYGVDPNRNYPYEWVGAGSSTDSSSDTYRGPSAGSEPEVQAMMNFFDTHQIRTHDSIHCYSNLTLYPWGYTTDPTPDDLTYQHMAAEMTKFNGYAPGQPADLLYEVNGGSFDWIYGGTANHDKVFTFTSEIGSSGDGFWPEENRRGDLFRENIWPHIYLMRVAGAFVSVADVTTTAPAKSTVKAIGPGETGELNFTIKNESVYSSASNITMTISTDDPWVQLLESERTLAGLASLQTASLGSNPIPFTVDANCPDSHLAPLKVTVHMPGGDLFYNLTFIVGEATGLLSDNMESGSGNWTTTGTWGLSTAESHSPANSLTDSPVGTSANSQESYAQLNGEYLALKISFWHRYDIETDYDYGRVQVSADGGAWETLASYTGLANSWQQVEFDLSAYSGQSLQFRFAMVTDYSIVKDGWNIDDVEILGIDGSDLPPATPQAIAPLAGQVSAPAVELIVANSTDPEGAVVNYGFRIYSNANCTNLIAAADNVVENDSGQTAWSPGTEALQPSTNYWWRAWAGDGGQRSLLSQPVGWTTTDSSPVNDLVMNNPLLRVLGNVSDGNVQLQLNLPAEQDVSVNIYDARGARVRSLHSGNMASGQRTLAWDGKDSSGRGAASGVYFVRVVAGSKAATGRVTLVK